MCARWLINSDSMTNVQSCTYGYFADEGKLNCAYMRVYLVWHVERVVHTQLIRIVTIKCALHVRHLCTHGRFYSRGHASVHFSANVLKKQIVMFARESVRCNASKWSQGQDGKRRSLGRDGGCGKSLQNGS